MSNSKTSPANGLTSGKLFLSLTEPDDPAAEDWSPSDLAAILIHQLDAPLDAEIRQAAGEQESHREMSQSQKNQYETGSMSIEQVLKDPQAKRSDLTRLKDYAKQMSSQPDELPKDVSDVLYIMALVAGQRAGHSGFSKLNSVDLERQRTRLLTLAWLPDRVRDLLR